MTDVHLIQRAQTGKSASAIQNMETLIESYAKALNKPENQAELRRLLAGKREKVWLELDMGRKIGRYVKQGSSIVKDAKKVQFLIKRTKNNPEGFYVETLELLP
ncbi:hypothetical protein FAI41_03845 [Acetobacteraceae bacterium]|nr:hypothetical protein FAI41_02495 [Acetobacteraceae bacterium]QCE32785.1 hypothetical protein FAI41_03845 [Acetobacteraceae bacterium]